MKDADHDLLGKRLLHIERGSPQVRESAGQGWPETADRGRIIKIQFHRRQIGDAETVPFLGSSMTPTKAPKPKVLSFKVKRPSGKPSRILLMAADCFSRPQTMFGPTPMESQSFTR